MINSDLSELLGVKKTPCISIIFPTHRTSPERRTDEPQLKKAVATAKQMVESSCTVELASELNQKIDELLHSIDFLHNKEGIGLYISPTIKKIVQFPFPVQEKIIVKESFEIREVLLLDNYSTEYFLLEITEKSARLFSGKIDRLQEINDESFPRVHEQQYEYSRPARGSSYVGNAFVKEFEKDKSIMEEIRMKEFLKVADNHLSKYLSQNTPLFISGTEKDTALFSSVTDHKKNIIGTIPGNPSYIPMNEAGMQTWFKFWEYMNEKKLSLIESYAEKVGEGRGVEGIEEVWKSAKAGRGLMLLVEKDYHVSVFLRDADDTLYLDPPSTEYTAVPDIVDEIIETVLQKDGDVAIVENGNLNRYRHIALITRY